MVTVDCHLHLTEVPEQVPHWWMKEMYRPYGSEYGSTDGEWMVNLLDASGIDIGMVQGSDIRRTTSHPDHPDEYEVYVPNDYTARQVSLYPDRLKGVASIDPMRSVPWALEELERCVKELDFRALKLLPSYQLYSPNDRRLDPIYEKAIELDIPVHFFTGWTPIINASLDLADPFLLDDVGRRFRDLKVIVYINWPWVDKGILMVAKHPNFYADLCYFAGGTPEPLHDALAMLKSYVAIDRVMYGSDNSDKVRVDRDFVGVPELYQRVNDVADQRGSELFSDEELAGIMGGNAARLYKLGT